MAKRGGFNRRDLRRFQRDLLKVVDRVTIARHFVQRHAKTVILAIIGSAVAGIGPGNKQYRRYAKAYARLIAKSGTQKRWLRGIEVTGREGGMLDEGNFAGEWTPQGRLFITWTGADEAQKVYGPVHQGTTRGGASHTKGYVPPRPFLHFENTRNTVAAMKATELTFDELVAQFNANRTPR